MSMHLRDTPVPPARAEAAVAREVVERALVDLQTLSLRAERAAVTDALEQCLLNLARLAQSGLDDPDHLDHLAQAEASVQRACAVLETVDHTTCRRVVAALAAVGAALRACHRASLELIVARQDRSARAPSAAGAAVAAPVFRASVGVPVVHQARDEVLTAALRFEPSRLEQLTDAEIAAPRATKAELDTPGSAGELAQLRRLARDCLEEIGSLGNLRVRRGPHRWSAGFVRFEERLLKTLDALAALGQPVLSVDGEELSLDVAGEALAYAADELVPDPTRAFARAFVLSCLAGEEAVRAAVLTLMWSHPLTHAAQRDALSLGSSAAVKPAMRRLCAEGDGRLLSLALDVLRARREATLDAVVPLLEHPDVGVRVGAIRCLPFVPEQAAAAALLRECVEDVEPRVMLAAAEGLTIRRSRAGLAAVRQHLQAELKRPGTLDPDVRMHAIELLGTAGEASDARMLGDLLQRRPREAEALGWHGHPALVELLIGALERSAGVQGDALFRDGVRRALARITGAEPSVESAAWRAFWAEHGRRFSVVQRYRFGHPYAPSASLDELCADGVPTHTRERCALEVLIVTGGAAKLVVSGWASALFAEVERLRERGREATHAPGEWLSARFRA